MKRGNGSGVGRLWDDIQSIGFYCSQGLDPSTLSLFFKLLRSSVCSTGYIGVESRVM